MYRKLWRSSVSKTHNEKCLRRRSRRRSSFAHVVERCISRSLTPPPHHDQVESINSPILVLVLLIDTRHQSSGRRQDFINKDEDGLLRRQLDALSDYIDELTDGQVSRDQVLLLVDGRNVGFLDLLADDGDAIGVLLTLCRRDVRRVEVEQRQRRRRGMSLRCVRLRPCASRMGARP